MHTDGTVKDWQKISNTAGGLAFALNETNPLGIDAQFGQSSAGVGDLDGDGIPDIAVGAPNSNHQDGAVWFICLTRNGTVKSATWALPEEAVGLKGSFGGRGIANLGKLDASQSRPQFLIGAFNTETMGAAYVTWLDGADWGKISKTVMISATGKGGFPFTAAGTASTGAGEQRHTDGAQFGNSVSALGDVDGDGVPDCAISANNGGNNGGKGVLYIVTLKRDGTVKNVLEINPACAQSQFPDVDGMKALSNPDSVPDGDRLCRSMSALGNVFDEKGNADSAGFTILCGAGASGDTGGDLWLFGFKDSGKLTSRTECNSSTTKWVLIVACIVGTAFFIGLLCCWYHRRGHCRRFCCNSHAADRQQLDEQKN